MTTSLIGMRFGRLLVLHGPIKVDKSGRRLWGCICDCGIKKEAATNALTSGNTRSCGRKENHSIQLVGKRFHKLLVIKKLPRRKYRNIIWLCKCDCGQYTKVSTALLVHEYTKSCGCFRRRRGPESPKWGGYGLISGKYWLNVKTSARKRNISFNLSIKDAWHLFEKQRGRCALSGCKLSFDVNASLDRIDNSQGYKRKNIQWIDKAINMMKSDLPQEGFLRLCRLISNYHNKKH